MKDAIKRAEWMKTSTSHHPIKARNHDEMLIRAHLASSSVSLHVRRTLDQSFYHNIDTQHRDQDQVVYRYQKDYAPSEGVGDPKIVMVDQMWYVSYSIKVLVYFKALSIKPSSEVGPLSELYD